jgi:hypothetical protein
MKKTFLPILFAAMLAFACTIEVSRTEIVGSGTASTEERSAAGVTRVELNLPGDLTISLGDAETLYVDSEDNLLPYIETKIWNGTLTLSSRTGTNIRPTFPLAFRLTVKRLDGLTVNSSGNITAPHVQTDEFSILSNSSGYILLAGLEANRLDVTLNSSGNVTVSAGRVEAQRITINSSGKYAAESMISTDAEVRISSSGKAILWVTDSLSASLTSSGNVEYYGTPVVTVSTSSSGQAIARSGR